MPQAFGHPPQWDHQLPRMNDLLAPMPPLTQATTAPTLLPPPNKDPRVSQYYGSQSLAQYRSPRANERASPSQRQDGLQNPGPAAHPLSRQVSDRDHVSHSLTHERRITYPIHYSGHGPMQRLEAGPTSSPYPPFRSVTTHAVNGDGGLRATRLTHEQKTAGGAPSNSPTDQASRPLPAPATTVESPWGFTKAGKARKRLEQACVSCRKKKTKCEPMSSSSKCLPCEKNGTDCYFDNT